MLLELLEERVLLSSAPLCTPDYRLAAPASEPAATSAPTGLSPSTIAGAYGFDTVMFGSIIGDGSGQTIAIVDAYDAPNIVADLQAFDVQFGLPAPPSFTVIGQDGTSNLPGTDPSGPGNSWAIETSLDVQWAHAMAPGADILLVEANSNYDSDLFAAVDTARNYPGVSVISMSWGGSEFSGQSAYDSFLTTPAGHNGVTFIASSGDYGAYDYRSHTKTVEYPAVSPNVLSVGGTTLTVDAGGNYVSESGWGDGSKSGFTGGSGGGISRYVAQPSYQAGVVTQSSTYRTVPDVSIDADPNSGVPVYDSWDFGSSTPWVQVGGTSLSAPLWGSLIAVVNQGRALMGQSSLDGPTQTLPGVYTLASTDLHDITTGNNGYAAGPGYDLVTGRGTPLVEPVVMDLSGFHSSIAGRHIFYNGSYFDGGSLAINSSDNLAIATDKTALLPGGTATFANYTSFSRGINGIMVDIKYLAKGGGLTPATIGNYFAFKVGNDSSPAAWSSAPAPLDVQVTAGGGDGGSDRVTITWADNAIQKQWLQVTALANTNTGLASDDVFYFGNAIGDSGNSSADTAVNVSDMLAVRANFRTLANPAPIGFAYDYNRDAQVNITDMLIDRANTTTLANMLQLITAPAASGGLAVQAGSNQTTTTAAIEPARVKTWARPRPNALTLRPPRINIAMPSARTGLAQLPASSGPLFIGPLLHLELEPVTSRWTSYEPLTTSLLEL